MYNGLQAKAKGYPETSSAALKKGTIKKNTKQ
jgi:hypothetical protein